MVALLLRIGFAGLICFALLAPRRYMLSLSLLSVITHYLLLACYMAVACIRSVRIARSVLGTLLFVCFAAFPFFYTTFSFIASMRRDGIGGADVYAWLGFFVFLALELFLPVALLIEFIVEKRKENTNRGRGGLGDVFRH